MRYDWCPFKSKDTVTKMQRPWDKQGRDGNVAAVSQETPRIATKHQKLKDMRKEPLVETSYKAWFCETSTPDMDQVSRSAKQSIFVIQPPSL